MTIDYAKAYSAERIAYAQMKQRQREGLLAYKAARSDAGRSTRTAIGELLITIGEQLSKAPSQATSTTTDVAHT